MIRMTIVFFLLAAVNSVPQDRRNWTLLVNPLVSAPPCKGYTNMYMEFEPGLPPDEENSYKVYVNEELPLYSQIKLKFDSEATIILSNETENFARVHAFEMRFSIQFFKKADRAVFRVKGPPTGTIPYMTSVDINYVEYCKEPLTAVFDNYLVGRKGTAHIGLSTPDDGCGRRKVVHTELIVNGQPTKHGDWPWHGAIYRLDSSSLRYICGGTLVSKTYVLTAAHCTTINGVAVLPEILSIIFGKYNLIGGDTDTQERKIHEIIVHAEFNHRKLHNDISLLKLKSEVTFNDFVQPACLWHLNAYKNLPFSTVYGAVVGWGFDHTDKLSPELRQTIIPMVSDSKCIKSNPDFFGKILNNQKFCAGYRNGTSACNGDSGGGFVIFVPDIQGDYSANATGSWFVRGIVSLAIARRDAAICDNTEYTLFTDIAKYGEWIENHMS
ncbi:chymotrypsin-like elastase family member 2A isoform X1 [Galleria mellonella]|uniref:Chymotrypsin-like elastase family member 2A isoform X1 n=1 Tax=Galleria mellonella TaxID=7137 RepID=A0ABM3MDL0_GALME|nr:chymotrypsin-like elastase family member 2A isoform X1 [Galleria mellonella]